MTSNIVPNEWPGGSGGSSTEVPHGDSGQVIRKLEVWDGTTSEGWHVVFGLSITWDDELHYEFGTKTSSVQVLQMGVEERISQMTVYTGQRVDGLYVTTTQGHEIKAGGRGGGQHQMEVGSGYLHGFRLSSGYVIDSLGPQFYKFHALKPSEIVTNELVGHGGGTTFWACKADFDRTRVKRIDVWYGSVLRAIQLTWCDDSTSKWYGTPAVSGDRSLSFVLHVDDAEVIQDMIIRGGDRVDAIWFKTSWNRTFQAGGEGGTKASQSVGNGYLTGFEGRSGYEIDSIAPIFLSEF